MLICLFYYALAEVTSVNYYNLNDTLLTKLDFKIRNFKFKIGDKTFIFSNGSRNYISDPCVYTLVTKNTFGYLKVCNGVEGLICTSIECLEIKYVKKKDPYHLDVETYPLDKVLVKFNDNFKSEIYTTTQSLSSDNRIIENRIHIKNKRIIKIRLALINEYDRYIKLKNHAYIETLHLFKVARKIINSLNFDNFSLDIVKTSIVNRSKSNLLIDNQKDPLSTLNANITKLKDINSYLYNSDLIVLLTDNKTNEKEGMSYLNGLGDVDTKYIIINYNPDDTLFYKAKVLVHEILHTLGSTHDLENKGYLMEKRFLNKKDLKIKLSRKSKKEIEKFVEKNKGYFFGDSKK